MPGQNLVPKTGAFNDFFKIDSQIKCFAFLLIPPITAYGSAQVTHWYTSIKHSLCFLILVIWYVKIIFNFLFMSFISRFEYVFKGFFAICISSFRYWSFISFVQSVFLLYNCFHCMRLFHYRACPPLLLLLLCHHYQAISFHLLAWIPVVCNYWPVEA